jgi:hypothetical protein
MVSCLFSLLIVTAPPVRTPPLEAVFAPLRWETRIEDLGATFAGASVEVQRLRDPERVLAVVTRAKVPALGDVMVTLEASREGRLHLIEYSFDDRRPECRLGGRDPQEVPVHLDCAWRHGPTALNTLKRWERIVRKELGPPSSRLQQTDGGVFLTWRRPTHEVFLHLARGDDGLWEISLGAQLPGPTSAG